MRIFPVEGLWPGFCMVVVVRRVILIEAMRPVNIGLLSCYMMGHTRCSKSACLMEKAVVRGLEIHFCWTIL